MGTSTTEIETVKSGSSRFHVRYDRNTLHSERDFEFYYAVVDQGMGTVEKPVADAAQFVRNRGIPVFGTFSEHTNWVIMPEDLPDGDLREFIAGKVASIMADHSVIERNIGCTPHNRGDYLVLTYPEGGAARPRTTRYLVPAQKRQP